MKRSNTKRTIIKLKLAMALFFFVSVFLKYNGLHFYPQFRFPEFPNVFIEENQVNYSTSIFTNKNDTIDILNLIAPYDQRFYLISSRLARDSEKKDVLLLHLQQIGNDKGLFLDSLAVSVSNHSIIINSIQ